MTPPPNTPPRVTFARNCTTNTAGIGAAVMCRQTPRGASPEADAWRGRAGGADSRRMKKLGMTAMRTMAACITNGVHSPSSTAANPPTTGPERLPICCTPNICVTCLPRWFDAPVSAMTVMRLIIHICSPHPARKR